MTDHGRYITIEIDEANLRDLVHRVGQDARPVRILDHGEVVADLMPVRKKRQLEPVDPKLKVELAPGYDFCEGLSEEDWPSHMR